MMFFFDLHHHLFNFSLQLAVGQLQVGPLPKTNKHEHQAFIKHHSGLCLKGKHYLCFYLWSINSFKVQTIFFCQTIQTFVKVYFSRVTFAMSHRSSPSSRSSSSCMRASSCDTWPSLFDFWELSRWDTLDFISLFWIQHGEKESWWGASLMYLWATIKYLNRWRWKMNTIKWMRWINEWCDLSCQEGVYLSLQSHLVTLQVLSASSLLQEFIPHLLHLSSRVQTLSSLQSHNNYPQTDSESHPQEKLPAAGDSERQTIELMLWTSCCLMGDLDWLHSDTSFDRH